MAIKKASLFALSALLSTLFPAADASLAPVYATWTCLEGTTELKKVDFNNRIVNYFDVNIVNDLYTSGQACNVVWDIDPGCIFYIDINPCPLTPTSSLCGDEIVIPDCIQPPAPEVHKMCSGMGVSVQPTWDATFTNTNHLDMSFYSDASDVGRGCHAMVVDNCAVPAGRKRRSTESNIPDAVEHVLERALEIYPITKSSSYQERKNRIKMRSYITAKLQEARASREEEDELELGSDRARRSQESSNCTCTAINRPTDCPITIEKLREIGQMPNTTYEQRNNIMCSYITKKVFCFDRFWGRRQMGCDLCLMLQTILDLGISLNQDMSDVQQTYEEVCLTTNM